MSHVFISYKREDETRVGRIARALEAANIEVWWDRGLPAGESWHANITAQLEAAGCVVVVWSQGAVGPEGAFVRDEARRGHRRDILVPVMIDTLKDLPLGFGEAQAIDLRHWKGDARDPFFQDLVAAVRAKLEGRPAPAPIGPKQRNLRNIRRAALGGVAAVTLAIGAAFVFNTAGVASKVCTAPGLQPGLSDVCGACGLAGRPTRAERVAWASLPAGSCPALRDFVSRFPQGAYRREAADLITAKKVTYEDRWTATSRSLPMFEGDDAAPASDEAAAKARALDRAAPDAGRLCRGFGSGTLFRFVAATPRAEAWRCAREGGGVVCGFDGTADCQLQQHDTVEHETCGAKR